MKKTIQNIGILLAFLAACMGIAWLVPEWASMGFLYFLILSDIIVRAYISKKEEENGEE